MKNTLKKAMFKIQEAIDLLEKVEGKNETVDNAAEALGYAWADLEFEHNSI